MALSLVGCSERNVQIGFLDQSITGKPDFSVDSDMITVADSASSVAIKVSCSSAVTKMEVQNPQTLEWKNVTEVVSGLSWDCSTESEKTLDLPLNFVAPYVSPANPGDVVQSFSVRWYVLNEEQEIYVFNRSISLQFKAPALTVTSLPAINIAHYNNGGYRISGTCGDSLGTVHLSGPFSTIQIPCSGGRFEAVTGVQVSGSGSDVVTVDHYPSSPQQRAYARVESNVQIDLDAPVVGFTSPLHGDKFGVAYFGSKSTVTVEGECSESMAPVKIFVGGVESTQATCNMGLSFTAEVPVAEGSWELEASQTDSAGNVGAVSGPMITKDTVPPGAFSIQGVRAAGVGDVTLDNLLSDAGLVVVIGSAADAVSYTLEVRDLLGTVVCSSQTSNGLTFDFSSCVLQNSTGYKVVASAKDATDNVTVASNNNFNFTTQFPVPQVSRVYALVSGVQYTTGATVEIRVEYDRDIQVSGGYPVLPLNTGAAVTASSVMGDKRTLRFFYLVGPDQYAVKLDASETTLTNCSDCLTDLHNPAVRASLNLPQTLGSTLAAYNILIDSVAPAAPTLSLGPVLPYYTMTPELQFTTPADPSGVVVEVRIVERVTLDPVLDWGPVVTSPVSLPTTTPTLQPDTEYQVEIRAQDGLGNTGPSVTSFFRSFKCPDEFVYAYNSAMGIAPFCVGQFEAKGGHAVPRFVPDGLPEAKSHMDAINRCNSMGPGYNLISNTEWQAVAGLIVQDPLNWNGDRAINGDVFKGNTLTSSVQAAVLGDPYAPNLVGNGPLLRRTHHLPYGQVIWDFAGNAMEVVYDTDSNVYSPNYVMPSQTGIAPALDARYGTTEDCVTATGTSYCGFGKIDMSAAAPNAVIWRGGSANYGSATSVGIFAALRSGDSTAVPVNSGYRCVYHP